MKATVRKLHVAEPPATYMPRPPIVVDCSAICGILFDEPWRGQAMEGTMLDWTITELMHLTRDELCNLAERIAAILPELEAGSLERLNALTSLDNIRSLMLRRDLHP